jgi:hypothetical protein
MEASDTEALEWCMSPLSLVSHIVLREGYTCEVKGIKGTESRKAGEKIVTSRQRAHFATQGNVCRKSNALLPTYRGTFLGQC